MDVPSGLRIKGTGGSPFEQIMMGMAQVGKGYLEEKPEAEKRKTEQDWKQKEYDLKKATLDAKVEQEKNALAVRNLAQARAEAQVDMALYGKVYEMTGSHDEAAKAVEQRRLHGQFPAESLADLPSKQTEADKKRTQHIHQAVISLKQGRMASSQVGGTPTLLPDRETAELEIAASYPDALSSPIVRKMLESYKTKAQIESEKKLGIPGALMKMLRESQQTPADANAEVYRPNRIPTETARILPADNKEQAFRKRMGL